MLENKLPTDAAFWLTDIQFRCVAAQSVITRIELLSQRNLTPNTLHSVQLWNDDVLELGLDEDVAPETIRVRRTHRRKLPDVVVVATALVNRLTLITRNTVDFQAIAGLRILNPHDEAALSAL